MGELSPLDGLPMPGGAVGADASGVVGGDISVSGNGDFAVPEMNNDMNMGGGVGGGENGGVGDVGAFHIPGM